MGVIDLSERIRSINRMNSVKSASPQDRHPEDIWEEKEAELVELAKKVETPADETAYTMKTGYDDYEQCDKPKLKVDRPVWEMVEELKKEIVEMREAFNRQAEELKKINKHVNATQKMLKKGAK